MFWVNVPIGVIAIASACGRWWSRATRVHHVARLVGTVLVTAGLFSLTFGLIKTNDHSLDVGDIIALLGGAVVLLGEFIVWERRVEPSRWCRCRSSGSASSRPRTWSPCWSGVAMFGSLYFITLYFQNIKGYSAIEAGVRSLPMTPDDPVRGALRRAAERARSGRGR